MKKSEVIKQGHYPPEFLKGLVSLCPSVKQRGNTKLIWSCEIHGEYSQSIEEHLKRPYCPKCASAKSREKGHQNRRAKNPFSPLLLSSLTEKSREDLINGVVTLSDSLSFYCEQHDVVYKQIAYHFISGNKGCPFCKRERMAKALQKSKRENNPYPQWFLSELSPKDYNRVLSGELSTNDKAEFVCPKHGVYSQVIYTHINGTTGDPKCGCPSCAAEISKYGSREESEVREFLSSFTEVQKVRGLIKGPHGYNMELDMYLPEFKLAVEFNGLYFHSYENLTKKLEPSVAKRYHLYKTEECLKKGITLIHLWEDDWCLRKSVVQNMLLSKIGKLNRERVYARNTTCRELSSEEASIFLLNNHIQGPCSGSHFGLFLNGVLLSVMSMVKAPSNTQDSGSVILNRYATVPTHFVVGGFEKLLEHATKGYKTVVSYADREISVGKLYERQGFKLCGVTPPDYKYVLNHQRVHKFNLRKEVFKKSHMFYDESLSESELAVANGIIKVYGCGLLKYKKNL